MEKNNRITKQDVVGIMDAEERWFLNQAYCELCFVCRLAFVFSGMFLNPFER